MKSTSIAAALWCVAGVSHAADIALCCPPTPYRSVADNPFRAGITDHLTCGWDPIPDREWRGFLELLCCTSIAAGGECARYNPA